MISEAKERGFGKFIQMVFMKLFLPTLVELRTPLLLSLCPTHLSIYGFAAFICSHVCLPLPS